MSYQIVVTVTDETPTVTVSGKLPYGKYTVSGHIDEAREDISAERLTPAHQLASRASSTHYKEV